MQIYLKKNLKLIGLFAGLPHGQEKSVKTKKNDKSQVKIRVFEKYQEKSGKLKKKNQILSVQIYQISYI